MMWRMLRWGPVALGLSYWALAFLLARVRWMKLNFERVFHRALGIPNTFTWGRCKKCGTLWSIPAWTRAGGCRCGSGSVWVSQPATTGEAARAMLELALTVVFRWIRRRLPARPPIKASRPASS